MPNFFYHKRSDDGITSFVCQKNNENPAKRNENCRRTVAGIQEDIQMNGLGQNFNEFMVEQGLYDEAKELAAKKLIALELKTEMDAQKLTKSTVAKKMRTSRGAVDNILNPTYNTSIGTLDRMAVVLGKRLSISLQ
jgi:hypothetical protein